MAIGSPQWMYASGEDAFTIDQSLRFNDDDSAYLSWTPSSAGNRRIWTTSAWVKRSSLGSIQYIWACTHTNDSIDLGSYFGTNDRLYVTDGVQGGGVLQTTQVFRDTSAWLHIVWALDTTQSTVNNRIKIYVNGVQVTDFANNAISSGISEDEEMAWMSADKEHRIGRRPESNTSYLDGYIAEFNFVDGLVKAPADFGETGDYGEWKPIEYEGTYGTNGFYLSFAGGGVMSATGGDSTATDGDYKAASFTSDGTFTPSADGYVEYLVIGGGGSGASNANAAGGGGGAGGYRTGMLPVTGGTGYSITVGDGGTSPSYPATGNDGDASVFSTITSSGGGGGGYGGQNGRSSEGLGNGSGGGAGYTSATGASGGEFGNDGGDGGAHTKYTGGGGGGASAAGGDGGDTTAGAGGGGLTSSITGSSVTRAGGGGGGHVYSGTAGAGGSGGGGSGGATASAGNAATANTGSGGGGASGNASAPIGSYSGGAGGSGIVIIRYKFQ